jgi:hypothetical protein
MHSKCFVAANRSARKVTVDHRCICVDATAVVKDEWVLPSEKADSEDVLFQATGTLVPDEIQPASTARLSWKMQDEVLRSSIAALKEVEYDQEAMLAAAYTVGILLYKLEDATKTELNKPDSVTVVTRKAQEEVLRSSISVLKEVENEQEAMLAAAYTVGMLLYAVEDAVKTAVNELENATVVASKVQDCTDNENF